MAQGSLALGAMRGTASFLCALSFLIEALVLNSSQRAEEAAGEG